MPGVMTPMGSLRKDRNAKGLFSIIPPARGFITEVATPILLAVSSRVCRGSCSIVIEREHAHGKLARLDRLGHGDRVVAGDGNMPDPAFLLLFLQECERFCHHRGKMGG